MNIGGVRIAGVSPRFWVILGVFAALVIGAMVLAPKEEPANTLYDPVFPAAKLRDAKLQRDGWIGNFVSNYGIFRPTDRSDFIDSYAENVGLPMRFKVYLNNPDEDEIDRPDLTFTRNGYSFMPATFVAPNRPFSVEEISEQLTDEAVTQPLTLGFREGATPPPASAYEVTALLWWRSDMFNPPTGAAAEEELSASPVLLVDSYQKLSASELRAPATQRVDLDLSYEEGDLGLALQRIEWSSGREVRACVAITNNSGTPLPVWNGVFEMTAEAGQGSVIGTPDETSSFSTASTLEPFQTLPGYITFEAAVSDPNQPLTLRMPSLLTTTAPTPNSLVVQVPTDNIESVSKSQSATTSCGTDDAAAGAAEPAPASGS